MRRRSGAGPVLGRGAGWWRWAWWSLSGPRRSAPGGAVAGKGWLPRRSTSRRARRRRCTVTVRCPATTSVKAVSSARKASASRSMKNVQGLPGRPAGAGFEVAQRGVVGPAGGDAVAGAVQLQPDVVPARVVAGVGHHRGGAVVEGEQGLRGGDVAELGEEVVTAGAAGGVDLDDLPAGDPPHGVEVVDASSRGRSRRRRRCTRAARGAGSRVVDRTVCTQPSSPPATASRAAR